MKENSISLGEILQKKRKELGLEIDAAANYLNVKKAIILEIENDQIDCLQDQKMYALGMIRSYARFLKIDVKIIDEQINLLHIKSNTDNKSHILLNVGEDSKLKPTKDLFVNFSLIAILLFLIALSSYNFSISKNSISDKEIISKLEELDGNQNQ